MKKQEGFTLVEMMVSLGIGMVILAAIYAMVNSGQKSTVNVERKVYANQDARTALDFMSLEIEMASYNPRPDQLKSTFWKDPLSNNCPNCSASGNQNYRGIQQATPYAITVQMNLDGSSNICDNPNESITYKYDAANQLISRSLDCGSGNVPFLGDLPDTWNNRSLRVINTSAVPVFRYFNASNVEIASNALPAGSPNIARIDVTLWVETADIDVNSGHRRQMVYSTSVVPRNHVLSR
jgi:prepilin-type N-terminal cleavage/methylation domain-containing protein